MIPKRFVIEYPERCLVFLDKLAPDAQKMDMMGTFAVMLASSMLTVPFERLQTRHPMHDGHDGLADALKQLAKMQWIDAGLFAAASPAEWIFSRIVNDPNEVGAWRNEKGVSSMSPEANTIQHRKVSDVLRVLRNALAHGNLAYLNSDGCEVAGERVEFLGFLCRYEESEEQRAAAETYRLVAVSEHNFLEFIRAWAGWVAGHASDGDFRTG